MNYEFSIDGAIKKSAKKENQDLCIRPQHAALTGLFTLYIPKHLRKAGKCYVLLYT